MKVTELTQVNNRTTYRRLEEFFGRAMCSFSWLFDSSFWLIAMVAPDNAFSPYNMIFMR
jgi:hypothetical protein